MTPKEWQFVFELLEQTARAARRAGAGAEPATAHTVHQAGADSVDDPYPDGFFKLTKANKLRLKTELEKWLAKA